MATSESPSSENTTRAQDAASIYVDRGWTSPLPLPVGRKATPPDDTTGNKPYVDHDELGTLWTDADDRANLAVRMPVVDIDGVPHEVIGIDVDQYGNKTGADTLRELEAKWGTLPPTFMSTSRDPGTGSGIRFFLVPAGKKWVGKPGPDIEIIQRTHRYAVAWPSVVTWDKGPVEPPRVYQWYAPDGSPCDPPPLAALAMLPETWRDGLRKGDAVAALDVIEFADDTAALEWLEATVHGYRKPMTPVLDSVVRKLSDNVIGGAYDAMILAVHEIVRLGAEGHEGIGLALEQARRIYFEEVLGANDGEARRDTTTAEGEWHRSLTGAAEKLRAELDNGHRQISPVGLDAASFAVDLDAFQERMLEIVASRISPIDTRDYDLSDMGRGLVFNAAVGSNLRPVLGGNDWCYWDTQRGALTRLDPRAVQRRFWSVATIESYKHTAALLEKDAQDEENEGRTERAESLRKQACSVHTYGVKSGDLKNRRAGLESAHTDHPDEINPEQFDREKRTLGVANGVLDWTSGAVVLRKGTPEDMILSSTAVPYEPGATHPLFTEYLDTFLPDPAVRRYVRKVLGYALVGGNPRRRIVFLKGGTSTGKSTLIEGVQAVFGDYATTFEPNALFRAKRDGGPSPELLAVFPRRAIFASEVGNRNRLHADVLKRMAGNDSVTARALYSNHMVTATPMFLPIIATNSMPTIEDADEALDRRLLVLPFEQTVPKGTDKDELKSVPEALVALFAWLVEGLGDYLREGLDEHVPDVVDVFRDEAMGQLNAFRRWATSTFEVDKSAPMSKRVTADFAWAYFDGQRGAWPRELREIERDDFKVRMRALYGNQMSRKVTVRKHDGTPERKTITVYETPIVLRNSTESE
ncbi:phage/plasmid primase, P4 family [Tsukamurella strandjordii]|uniref:Phage/plasmid primase, P4 family n=1 Tax=Tsukamurella strandjordii TaxID=147577 RepID=A0AA90S8R1_9ACTN|nr:phage/plasmid primase, P4 family [Tsukamurella strandjordii]MDP0399185.1 phage/plasmid primase, P4 family [Tsukamurella strandjordii]